MIYTELTIKALNIAYDCHKEQYDKGGVPYIFHPYHIAEQMDTEEEICVALLHDVLEDSSITVEELYSNFPKEIVEAVVTLTRKPEVSYFDYINNVKTNKLAMRIKIEDLKHNMDNTRVMFSNLTPDKIDSLHERYKKALDILQP